MEMKKWTDVEFVLALQHCIVSWNNGASIDTSDQVPQEHGSEKRLSTTLKFKDVVEEYLVAPHHR